MMGGYLPYRLKELHEQYGPVVRVAPNELSFIDAAAWKDIYAPKEYIRPKEWRNRLPGKNSDHFISADVETHTRFRKVFNAAFSEQALRKQEPIVHSYISSMMQRFDEAIDNSQFPVAINVVDLFNFTTFDIIGDLGWGKSFGCLEKMEYHPWVTVVLHFKMTMFVAALKYYPLLDRLMAAMTPASALESIKMITTTAEENVSQRLALGNERPDFMSYAMKHNALSQDSSTRITNEELETNGMAFIVGGSDTLTTALAGTVNCLLQSPTALETLVKEIRNNFSNEGDIDYLSTLGLPYLKAVIEEGLRMCPPVPDIMRRQIAGGDTVVAQHPVPNGTVVGIPMLAAYRSSRNFVFADEFHPERWLSSEKNVNKFQGDDKAAFQPFAVGPAGCIGQNLARMELRIILARFLWRFDISVPTGKKPLVWTDQKIWWSWNKDPIVVTLARAR